MKAAVQAAGLSQRFGASVALRGVDLEVAAGERLAVLGDNGAGKTTLLRLLATVARPDSGQLHLFGLDALRQREALRPRIGYLSHQPGLYAALSALENLELYCTLRGLPRGRAGEALEQAGLAAGDGRAAGRLSRGQQQRVALARSLLHDPELWILDEPDASLDAAGRALVARRAEGRTVVLATHDSAFARSLCDRSLRLKEGRGIGDSFGLEVISRGS